MGTHIQGVSNTGKLKLEGAKWVKGPSRLQTDPKSQNKIKVKVKRGEVVAKRECTRIIK